MKTVARLSAEDRSDLFRNTANRMQMSDAIVEKDFWVCFTLDYLFHHSHWKDSITFKGGTSLSKAYHLINRFSEDIDLILDWRILGYSLNEPWEERSNTKQDTFNKEANQRAEVFLAHEFVPTVKRELSAEINTEAQIYIDQHDPQTVIFAYPRILTEQERCRLSGLKLVPLPHGLRQRPFLLCHMLLNSIPVFLNRQKQLF